MTPEEKRASRRASMPKVTAIVEWYEKQGLDVKVIYAEENGLTYGKKPVYQPWDKDQQCTAT